MEEKPYKVKTGSGRMEVSALIKGKPHSVSVPYPVERQLTKWEAARMRLGDILLIIVNIGLIYVVIWLIRRRKR